MDERRINEALRDATDTQHVVIGEGTLASVGDVFERSFGNRAAVVIGDENTFEVAGTAVNRALEATGRNVAEPFVFAGDPTLHATALPEWWLCPSCRAVLLGDGQRGPDTAPRRAATVADHAN